MAGSLYLRFSAGRVFEPTQSQWAEIYGQDPDTTALGIENREFDSAVTLDAITLAGDATSAIAADASVTLSAFSVLGVATAAIAADLAQTIAAVTLLADGTVAYPARAADLAVTVSDVSADAAAANAIAATVAQTLGAATITADATAAITADLSQSLSAFTLTADASEAIGAVLDPVAGAPVEYTLDEITLAFTGSVSIASAASNSLDVLVLDGAAGVGIAAALSSTLDAVTLASDAGELRTPADLAATLGDITLAADATVEQPTSLPAEDHGAVSVMAPELWAPPKGGTVSISGGGAVTVEGHQEDRAADKRNAWWLAAIRADNRRLEKN